MGIEEPKHDLARPPPRPLFRDSLTTNHDQHGDKSSSVNLKTPVLLSFFRRGGIKINPLDIRTPLIFYCPEIGASAGANLSRASAPRYPIPTLFPRVLRGGQGYSIRPTRCRGGAWRPSGNRCSWTLGPLGSLYSNLSHTQGGGSTQPKKPPTRYVWIT